MSLARSQWYESPSGMGSGITLTPTTWSRQVGPSMTKAEAPNSSLREASLTARSFMWGKQAIKDLPFCGIETRCTAQLSSGGRASRAEDRDVGAGLPWGEAELGPLDWRKSRLAWVVTLARWMSGGSGAGTWIVAVKKREPRDHSCHSSGVGWW